MLCIKTRGRNLLVFSGYLLLYREISVNIAAPLVRTFKIKVSLFTCKVDLLFLRENIFFTLGLKSAQFLCGNAWIQLKYSISSVF